MKTIVKYPGSKWRLAEQIVSLFPKHHSYLEPFFGSGAVLFSKPRSNIETVNDLDGDVANLFQCIQKDPEKLSRMVYFTPFSRQIYDESYNSIPSDPYEKAVWFLIRCNMGYWYRTNGYKVGWKRDVQGRERAYAAKDWSSLPGSADRMPACNRTDSRIQLQKCPDLLRSAIYGRNKIGRDTVQKRNVQS